MKPSVSIIVPVYNAEACLSRCVESVLNQEYESFELLLNILEEAGELPARVPYEDLVITNFSEAAK